jgi:hypothetical protein
MRGRKLLLRHSVKHYKAMDNLSKTLISFSLFYFMRQNYNFSLKQHTNDKYKYNYDYGYLQKSFIAGVGKATETWMTEGSTKPT